MKRLMKVMVAAVTSICMLAINLPITTISSNAATITYGFRNIRENDMSVGELTIDGQTTVRSGEIGSNYYVLEPNSLIEMDYTSYDGDPITSLKIYLDDISVLESTDHDVYELEHYVQVQDIQIDGATLKLSLKTIYRVDWTAQISRSISFEGATAGSGVDLRFPDGRINGITTVYDHDNDLATPPITAGTFYLEEVPQRLTVSNPGEVGGERMGKLNAVKFNGQAATGTLNHYDLCTFEVPVASNTGLITLDIEGDFTQAFTFSWLNYDAAPQEEALERERITSGEALVVAIYQEDMTTPADGYNRTDGYIENGVGNIIVQSGYWIEFELKPIYGAQINGLSENGITPINGILDRPNHYMVQVPQDHNVHLQPEYAEDAHDEVRNDADAITGGAIALSDHALSSGTGALTVDDNTLTSAEITSMEENWNGAGDLTVQDSLSLDMDNVFTIPNTNGDEWAIPVNEFENNGNADITLRMDRVLTDVDFNSIVIVHEHTNQDGSVTTTYINDVDYDTDTNTITFNTSGFSDFTIATVYDPSQPAIEVNPNPSDPFAQGNDQQGQDEGPEDERPHYVIENTNEGIGLYAFEYHEDIDDVVQMPCEPGFFVQDDAIIDMSESVPGNVTIKMNIDGEVQDYHPGFCPEHWVIFDGVTVDGNTYTFNFSLCWNVTVGAIADASIAVYGENGLLTPIGECRENPVSVNIDENEDEPYAMAELFFDTEPSYIKITGNDYMMMYVTGVEDEDLSPLGTTTVNYPEDNRGFMWLEIGGIQRNEEDTYIFDTDGIAGATYMVNGSATGDHAIVIQGFASSAIPASASSAMSSLIEGSDYSNAVFLYGFDIYLVDGNGIVTDPGYSVTITIRLEEAVALEDGQTLFLVHMHGNGANATYELIEVVYNATNKTITFTTSSFSPFVLNKGTKTEPVTPVATPANEETPAVQTTTTEAAPATAPAAAAAASQTTQAAAQAARTGEAQSYNGTVGIILILSSAALVFYVWRKETELEWFE